MPSPKPRQPRRPLDTAPRLTPSSGATRARLPRSFLKALNVPPTCAAILAGSLVLSSTSRAEGKELDAVPLEKGDPAPFSGQLISTETAVRIVVGAEISERRCALEIEHARESGRLALEHERELREIERRALTSRLAPRPWYEHPIIVAGASFVGTMALVFAIGNSR